MSESDPYAAPNVEYAKEVAAPVEQTTAEKPVDAPVTEEITVPEGSIKEVLGWVGDDATKAQSALDAETAGDKRKTLIKELNEILNK